LTARRWPDPTRLLASAGGWLFGFVLVLWRLTCRYRVVNDPRPELRRRRRPYAYALLHAHQVAAVFVNDEERLAAMVSRSADGDMLVPSLTLRGVAAVRGSTRRGDRAKGGRAALAELTRLAQGRVPVLLAVDGPLGPRGHVHSGVVDLAREAGATILPTAVVSSSHWILPRSWDRFQVPKPFSEIALVFGTPIEIGDADTESLRTSIADALEALEREHDPEEWRRVRADPSVP
jgi:hypothetical protein